MKENFSVLFDLDDVGVFVCNAYSSGIISFGGSDDYIKDVIGLSRADGNFRFLHVLAETCTLLLCGMSYNLKGGILVTHEGTCGTGCFYTASSLGVGNDDALHIFYDISAGRDMQLIRHTAKY